MKELTSPEENPREARALARFAAVQVVVQARQNGSSLTQALHHAAQQTWDGRIYSQTTIEDWVYRYRHGQFAALQNQPRCDRGHKRALDPAALEASLKLRREHPLLTVKALTGELVRRGFAWWYRSFANADREPEAAEKEARDAGRGLWLDKAPISPRGFRQNVSDKKSSAGTR